MPDGGKGSRPRPFSVSQQEYDSRWDAIFGKDLKKENKEGELQAEAFLKDEYYDLDVPDADTSKNDGC